MDLPLNFHCLFFHVYVPNRCLKFTTTDGPTEKPQPYNYSCFVEREKRLSDTPTVVLKYHIAVQWRQAGRQTHEHCTRSKC